MATHVGFSLGIGAYFIYTLFHKVGEDDVNNCIAKHSNDSNKEEECRKDFHYFRNLMIGFFIVFWLLELCASLFFLQMFYERNCLLMDVQGVISSLPNTSHN